jgi:hypothetical protein
MNIHAYIQGVNCHLSILRHIQSCSDWFEKLISSIDECIQQNFHWISHTRSKRILAHCIWTYASICLTWLNWNGYWSYDFPSLFNEIHLYVSDYLTRVDICNQKKTPAKKLKDDDEQFKLANIQNSCGHICNWFHLWPQRSFIQCCLSSAHTSMHFHPTVQQHNYLVTTNLNFIRKYLNLYIIMIKIINIVCHLFLFSCW